MIPPDEPGEPADWHRIDKILLAHTTLKPWELTQLTVPEACVLITSIMEKNDTDNGGGSTDAKTVQAQIERAVADAALYRSLTLDQKLEIARREIEG